MINRFEHGDDGYQFEQEVIADFSTNTWNLGPDPQLLSVLQEQLNTIGHYPEVKAESLAGLIAESYGLHSNQVLVCNGTIESIFLLAQLYAGKKSRIISPTFSEYEHACEINNHSISFCGENFINAGLNTESDIFWLCNPNNPSGQLIKAEPLRKLIKNNPQTLFVIDEAYMDFCLEDESLISSLQLMDNLVILKSMTKNSCLPGLRLGYLLCSTQLYKRLSAIKSPWSVNALAVAAGKYTISNPRITDTLRLQYHSEARALANELKALGFEVTPSHTGYFLVKTPIESSVLKAHLLEKYHLLIRDAANFRTLSKNHIRVASLGTKRNTLLIDALKMSVKKLQAVSC
ncbi:pyridoxal phosphate-dependent aminotransferase [Carboxylicivirga sp. N1Y90]|uniref:pyridoxal phosphate-dependent aminotransferase n=1 Tax=Carboxylicivirga fragile TaxID=3417571 RepID=UPI003D32F6A6|nr:aminotransferase class I/II-fold pyridoxal phosphate-dependent enzyme [Marinilabiliaceae bacterium N1Y90]